MVNRPACKNEYNREEEKKQEKHFVKVHRDWDEKPPPSKAKDTKKVWWWMGNLIIIGLMMEFQPIITSDNIGKGIMGVC